MDLTMAEVDEASKIITAAADPDANIIFGATIDETMHDQIKITVIATGFDESRRRLKEFVSQTPQYQSSTFGIPQANPTEEQNVPEPAMAEEKKEDKKEEDDFFDIPAFLRQRN